MSVFTRRAMLGASAATLASLGPVSRAIAQAQCVTGPLPGFLPNYLTVDCASRQNFQLFRQNSDYVGLTGVVSMSAARGKLGTYEAGNLFLFPWLKPSARKLGVGKVWNSVMPQDATLVVQASPIPNALLPLDVYFCQSVLQAPTNAFIGFAVDTPFSALEAKIGLYTNVDKLADGKAIGIDWASAGLNRPWFGGSGSIPATEVCNGKAWRSLIAAGLNTASSRTC